MAKEILDIYVEAGYEYNFNLDVNDSNNDDLESEYDCYFECKSIGKKKFSIVDNAYLLILSEYDTNKLTSNLEEYEVYGCKINTGVYEKFLTGRIHIDKKIKV